MNFVAVYSWRGLVSNIEIHDNFEVLRDNMLIHCKKQSFDPATDDARIFTSSSNEVFSNPNDEDELKEYIQKTWALPYKNEKAFKNKQGICFIPINAENFYTYEDLLFLSGEDEEKTEILFNALHEFDPEFVIEEEELFKNLPEREWYIPYHLDGAITVKGTTKNEALERFIHFRDITDQDLINGISRGDDGIDGDAVYIYKDNIILMNEEEN